MKKYRLAPESDPHKEEFKLRGNWLIWADGPVCYFDKLRQAFPDLSFKFIAGAKAESFKWCARMTNAVAETRHEVDRCLHLFSRTLYIENRLAEVFALGWHSRPRGEGKPPYTTLGQWVHLAKSYSTQSDGLGNTTVADLIAEQMAEFIQRHPLYKSCDGILSVPPSNPDKTFDLPAYLATNLEENCGIPFMREALFKRRLTAQMKYCPTIEDKLDNITDSIGAKKGLVAGKQLLIIDDIFESGVTFFETAKVLRAAQATALYGLVATKTLRRKFS